jgi:hypothetical protein
MVLALMPATVWDTRTLKLQLPPAGNVPPGMMLLSEMVADVEPAVPVMVVAAGRVTRTPFEKHDAVSAGVLAIRMLAGNTSLKMLVTVLLTVFGLEMMMVSVVEPTADVEVVGLNDLLIVGTLGSETFCTWNEAEAATVLLPAVVVSVPTGMSLV